MFTRLPAGVHGVSLVQDLDELELEVSNLMAVRHPNLVHFYGVSVHDQCVYIITEVSGWVWKLGFKELVSRQGLVAVSGPL